MSAKLFSLTINLVLFIVFTFSINVNGNQKKIVSTAKPEYDSLKSENIKTIILKNRDSDYMYPVIELNSSEKLSLRFDDMDVDIKNYSYKIIMYTSNWRKSDISHFDYLEGFEINPVRNYESSFNTLINYTHYWMTIPNEDIQIIKSGNYQIQVFDESNEEKVLFERKFMVYEKLLSINAICKRATNIDYRNTSQEIDFTIHQNNYQISNPYEDIRVVILQNGRWDNAITDLKPQFIRDNELVYNYDLENVFPGGNEFRHFNCKNTRFKSENIQQIEYQKPYFHIKLNTDEKKVFKQYFTNPDLNGSFKIDLERANDPNLEADYVYVYYSLKTEIPYLTDDVFVIGAFNAWELNEQNKMIYNFDKGEYQLKLLLKQGYYNYIYTLKDKLTNKSDSEIFEGNHYQTENDYLILVYVYDRMYETDLLIGYQLINSISK